MFLFSFLSLFLLFKQLWLKFLELLVLKLLSFFCAFIKLFLLFEPIFFFLLFAKFLLIFFLRWNEIGGCNYGLRLGVLMNLSHWLDWNDLLMFWRLCMDSSLIWKLRYLLGIFYWCQYFLRLLYLDHRVFWNSRKFQEFLMLLHDWFAFCFKSFCCGFLLTLSVTCSSIIVISFYLIDHFADNFSFPIQLSSEIIVRSQELCANFESLLKRRLSFKQQILLLLWNLCIFTQILMRLNNLQLTHS